MKKTQSSLSCLVFLSKRLLCTVSVLGLAGCMVGPHYQQPKFRTEPHLETHNHDGGKTSPQSVVTTEKFDDNWWKNFHDPELVSLEEKIVTQNLSFQLATTNLVSSRAQMMIAGAERFPALAAQGSYQRTQFSSKQFQHIIHQVSKGREFSGSAEHFLTELQSSEVPSLNQWQDSIDATYEVDLWGRVAHQYQAAKAFMQMTEEEQRSVLISRQADMARDYLQLRGDQKRQRILIENKQTLEKLLHLTESRYKSGLVTELDVDSVKSRLHNIEAEEAHLTQIIAEEMNAIALLLGAPPRSLDVELTKTASIPTVPPYVPIGLSSELVHRRPDIREAEEHLRASVEEVGEATADFYPKVTINADFGFQTLSFRDLGFWNARAWNVGPSVSLPIFQGGRLTGQLKLKKAEEQSAAISYRQVVLKAWNEVDNALQAYHDEQNRREGLMQTVQDEERSFHLALSQYRSGLATYLEVLNAQTNLEQAQLTLASSDAQIATNLAKLYNALGGGWQEVLPELHAKH